jgi:hypothetical protein
MRNERRLTFHTRMPQLQRYWAHMSTVFIHELHTVCTLGPLIHTHYSLGRGLPKLAWIRLIYSSMKFSTITCSDFHNLTSWNLPVRGVGPGCSYIETRMLPSSSEHRSTLGGEINEWWMSTNLCILWSRTTLWHPSVRHLGFSGDQSTSTNRLVL